LEEVRYRIYWGRGGGGSTCAVVSSGKNPNSSSRGIGEVACGAFNMIALIKCRATTMVSCQKSVGAPTKRTLEEHLLAVDFFLTPV